MKSSESNSSIGSQAPLASRMRPRNLDEVIGHKKVIGPNQPLRRWIELDRVPSLLLWGPPGCGKTTLARVVAVYTKSRFVTQSAVTCGVKEVKEIVAQARYDRDIRQLKTILFLDEIHRFSKSQQDVLLPHVEDGTVTLIGATTENPSFEINSALISRVRILRLERLEQEELIEVLEKAMTEPNRGLGGTLTLSSEALQWIAQSSEGDVRKALTTLEAAAMALAGTKQESEKSDDLEPSSYSLDELKRALDAFYSDRVLNYDKKGEEHYNVISAFIKSLRDSDPHAALYYLARMIQAGEDPLFIARRLVIFASEDVGNADPRALNIALNVKEAVEFVGMPEARINLAQGVTFLAMAPKSNASYMGLNEAMAEVQKSGGLPVPFHLRNAVTSLMKSEGYGKGYRYAHDYPEARPKQSHLPEDLLGRRFYSPKEAGLEKAIKEKLDRINPDFD